MLQFELYSSSSLCMLSSHILLALILFWGSEFFGGSIEYLITCTVDQMIPSFLINRIIQDICHSWLRFEREFGTLEDFDHAARKVHFAIYLSFFSLMFGPRNSSLFVLIPTLHLVMCELLTELGYIEMWFAFSYIQMQNFFPFLLPYYIAYVMG